MCMIASGVNRYFGVLASDSSQYVADDATVSFESPKLILMMRKYVMSFIGSPLYFVNIDKSKFNLDMLSLSLYLQKHLSLERPKINELMKEVIKDKEENKPNFCLFILGVQEGLPTLIQFNSFNNFKPKFLSSDKETAFSSIYFGDDQEKNKIFKKSTEFMETEIKKYSDPSPGLVGEVLTRGIYRKADLEEEKYKTKYAGGVVNCAVVHNNGRINSLSGMEDIWQ